MINTEIWKSVSGFDDFYEASNLGNIRSKDRIVKKFSFICKKEVNQFYYGKLLKQQTNKLGYKFIHIGINGKKYNIQSGSFILRAFAGEPKQNQVCCHNDGNPSNNLIENLRWGTHKENMEDRKKHGRYKGGSEHHYTKAPKEIIDKVKDCQITIQEAMLLTGLSYKIFWRAKRGETWS